MKKFLVVVSAAVVAVGVMVGGCGGDDDSHEGWKGTSFTDSRDGKSYRVVRIGDSSWVNEDGATSMIRGLAWMAENLNFKADSSYCYDNDESNCEKYGRLYNWNAAVSVCPKGWRLPTEDDFKKLVQGVSGYVYGGNKIEGKSLKSKEPDWDGTDDFGFSALPGGYCQSFGYMFGEFISWCYDSGNWGEWWGADEYDSGSAHQMSMHSGRDDVPIWKTEKSRWLSVRCVRD